MLPSPYIVLDDQISHQGRFYNQPLDIVEAFSLSEITPAFDRLNQYHQQGYYIAGYCAYELGYGFEHKLQTLLPPYSPTPLLQFGVFRSFSPQIPVEVLYQANPPLLNLKPCWSQVEYTKSFNKVKAYIQAGDVYQINLSFPLQGEYTGCSASLYAGLRRRQKGAFGAVVSLGESDILSFSPELFFHRQQHALCLRPMKGTRARHPDIQKDEALRMSMYFDRKSQAENLMIVDLLRNDLARICEAGSVKVPKLFTLECYPTVHQMTSTITGQLIQGACLEDILKSLFPCGSVTGAPKIRAMEIIHELEPRPRGAYCGAIGYWDPDDQACFNVAIRTLVRTGQHVRYNIGSGLVFDSQAEDEYDECMLKAAILNVQEPQLLETFLWRAGKGAPRLEAHLARLQHSACTYNYPCDIAQIRTLIDAELMVVQTDRHVRLSLDGQGRGHLTHTLYQPLPVPVKLILSAYPLEAMRQTLTHKISWRDFYDGEWMRLCQNSSAREVIFANPRNELCEGSFTALFVQKNGSLWTPPTESGRLPSLLQAELVETGQAAYAILRPEDLLRAEKIYVGNALRGLMEAHYLGPESEILKG